MAVKLMKVHADALRAIELDVNLNMQQRADKMSQVFADAGSDIRVIVASGKVPRLRFIVNSRRPSDPHPDTSVSG